jgi:hypothetical protein
MSGRIILAIDGSQQAMAAARETLQLVHRRHCAESLFVIAGSHNPFPTGWPSKL